MLYNLLFLGFLISTKVVLNLERINPYVIHTGITFKRLTNNIRFDYRSFNDNNNYITTDNSRRNFREMFPGLNLSDDFCYDDYNTYRKDIDIYKKDILLGYTNYSLLEIMNYEKTLHIFC